MAVITLLIVSLIVFTLMELVPGTCAERYLAFKNTQGSGITVEDIEAEKRRLGLDRPFPVRFGTWIKNIVVDGILEIVVFFELVLMNYSKNDFIFP